MEETVSILCVYGVYVCLGVAGFQGEDCSVDMDLCSLGTCQEHTVTCTETGNGQNVTCICEKGNSPWTHVTFQTRQITNVGS